ncbi:MAG: nucleotidyltransferase domain-containing protein [Methyloprofundus sp.]|nr:nucleotidyltransferase domain-containing protein [Methyloprofundus sp.]MDT8426803.1 nucleotidyltransferase domain-containing protein [Methyloprofundus sp.]
MTDSMALAKLAVKPEEWKEINQILKTYAPLYEVWAFGSRVTGKAKQFSDLDLAIITQQSLPLSEYAIIKEAFDESDLPFKVDIVDWAATSINFQEIIKANKVSVQSAQDKIDEN